jgi:hypothetical protein
MRTATTAWVTLTSALVFTLGAAQSEPALLLAAIAAVALTAAIVLAVPAREVTVGARARAHLQVLVGMPAPRHPATAGRPMARAPGETATA